MDFGKLDECDLNIISNEPSLVLSAQENRDFLKGKCGQAEVSQKIEASINDEALILSELKAVDQEFERENEEMRRNAQMAFLKAMMEVRQDSNYLEGNNY